MSQKTTYHKWLFIKNFGGMTGVESTSANIMFNNLTPLDMLYYFNTKFPTNRILETIKMMLAEYCLNSLFLIYIE